MYPSHSRNPRPNPLTNRYTSRWFILPLPVMDSFIPSSIHAAKPCTLRATPQKARSLQSL